MKKILIITLSILFATGCGSRYEIANIDSTGKNIICFGNSITEGIGGTSGNDYPNLLSEKLGIPVINAGLAGDTTKSALKRLKAEVLNKDPKIVIIELGGNDFLGGVETETTDKNLDQIVKEIQAQGAMVVILGIKTLPFDKYSHIYKKIAKERRAYLMPDILKGIITKRQLMNDRIHPNDAGYQIIADRVSKVIKPLLDLNKQKKN